MDLELELEEQEEDEEGEENSGGPVEEGLNIICAASAC